MNQTESGTGVFSVRNGAILGGVATAIGYLLLIIQTVVHHDSIPEPGPIIARGVFGCILGLLVLGLHAWLERNIRLIAVSVTGLVLLLLKLLAPSRLALMGDATIVFGVGYGALALGFALAIFTMACLVARRDSPENNVVRYALLGLGITGTLLYLVAILAALAEKGRNWRGLGAIFGSGNVPLIIFASLALLGLVGVLVIGLIAGTKHVAIKNVCQWGIALGVSVFYLSVGYIFLNFFVELLKQPERVANLILALVVNLVAGVGTVFGAALICAATLGRALGLLAAVTSAPTIQGGESCGASFI
jgi:hypothetical protein